MNNEQILIRSPLVAESQDQLNISGAAGAKTYEQFTQISTQVPKTDLVLVEREATLGSSHLGNAQLQ